MYVYLYILYSCICKVYMIYEIEVWPSVSICKLSSVCVLVLPNGVWFVSQTIISMKLQSRYFLSTCMPVFDMKLQFLVFLQNLGFSKLSDKYNEFPYWTAISGVYPIFRHVPVRCGCSHALERNFDEWLGGSYKIVACNTWDIEPMSRENDTTPKELNCRSIANSQGKNMPLHSLIERLARSCPLTFIPPCRAPEWSKIHQ